MQRNWIIVVAILVMVAAALAYIVSQRGKVTQLPSPTTEVPAGATLEVASPAATTSETSPSAQVTERLVNITSAGFSPKEVTIKAGEAVTWMNGESVVHVVNSAVHPTHQLYLPLNLGNIQAGGKASLTFPTAGTYKYHNHLNPSLTGSIVVE